MQQETTIHRYRGLSTETKPGIRKNEDGVHQTPKVGSVLTETDTGHRYVWMGDEWVLQEQTIEPLLLDINDSLQGIASQLAAIIRGHEEYLWEDETPPE